MSSDIKINSTNFFVNKLETFEEIINMNLLKTQFPLDDVDSGFYRINFAEKQNMGAGTINSNYNRPPVGPIKKGLYCSYCYRKGPMFHTGECPYPDDKSLYLTLGGFNELVVKNPSYDGDFNIIKQRIINGNITQSELNEELLFIIDEIKLSESETPFNLEKYAGILSKIQFSGIIKKRGPKKLANKTATTQFLNSAIIFYKDGTNKTSIRVSKNGLLNLINVPKEPEKLNFLIRMLIDKIKKSGALDIDKFEELTGMSEFVYLPYKSYIHSITAQFSVSRDLEIDFENLNSVIAPTDSYGNLLNSENTRIEKRINGFSIIVFKGIKIIEWSYSSGKISRNQTMIKEYIKFVTIPAPGIKITGIINKYGVIMLTMSRCGEKIMKDSLCGDTFTPLSENFFNEIRDVFVDFFAENNFLFKKSITSNNVKPERNTISGYAPPNCRPIRTRKLKDGTSYYEQMHPIPYSWKGQCPDPNYQFLDPMGLEENGIFYPCCEAKSKKSIEKMKEYLIKGFPSGVDSNILEKGIIDKITEDNDPQSGIIVFGSNIKGATARVLVDDQFETVTVVKKLSKKNNDYEVINTRTGETLVVNGEDFKRESRYFRGLNSFTKDELLSCIKSNLYNYDLKINSKGEVVHDLISNLNEKYSLKRKNTFLSLMISNTKIRMKDLTYYNILDLTKNRYLLKNLGSDSHNFFLVFSREGIFFINYKFNTVEPDVEELFDDTIILNGFLSFNVEESKYVYTIISLVYYNESLEDYTFIDRELILRELLTKFTGITDIIFVYPDNYIDLIEGSNVIIENNNRNKFVLINTDDINDNILYSDKDKYSDIIELQILEIDYMTYTIEFGYENKEFPVGIGIDLIRKYTFFEKLPSGLKSGEYLKLKINRDTNGNIVPNRKISIYKKSVKTLNYEYVVDLLLVKFNPINYTFFSENDKWYYFNNTLVYDGEKLAFTEDI